MEKILSFKLTPFVFIFFLSFSIFSQDQARPEENCAGQLCAPSSTIHLNLAKDVNKVTEAMAPTTNTATPTETATPTKTATPTEEASDAPELIEDKCSFDLDDKGEVIIEKLAFKGPSWLKGKRIFIDKKQATLKENDSEYILENFKTKSTKIPEKVTIRNGKNKEQVFDLSACSDRESLEEKIEDRKEEFKEEKKAKKEAERREYMAQMCGGGEGKEVSRYSETFILCRNGVSESEARMINRFCAGGYGDYDAQEDKVYCEPFMSYGPPAPQFPQLPAPIFGPGGINGAGFR